MILLLVTGVFGLVAARHGRTDDTRFLGLLAAVAGLLAALLFPGAW